MVTGEALQAEPRGQKTLSRSQTLSTLHPDRPTCLTNVRSTQDHAADAHSKHDEMT